LPESVFLHFPVFLFILYKLICIKSSVSVEIQIIYGLVYAIDINKKNLTKFNGLGKAYMKKEIDEYEFYASAIPGTEQVLCDELRSLNFRSVRLNRGGIPFRGSWREGWRACLQSRIAQRIQVLLDRFPARSPEELYKGVQKINWPKFLSYKQTLSVSSFCAASHANHSGFVALKAKDAIVDRIRDDDLKMRRPSISKEDPDVRVFVYLVNDKATIYLDLSGDALHRRGYKLKTGKAPLRETLAAAMIQMADWDRKTPFLDPMCGSGTLAIEAAMLAANIAPGLLREKFGFERWFNFGDNEVMEIRKLRGELRRAATSPSAKIQASDIDPEMLEFTKINARKAGVKLSLKERSALNTQWSSSRTLVVTNPPYDVRLGVDEKFRHGLSSAVCRMHGWRVGILAGHTDYKKFISSKPEKVLLLPNGNLKCDFLVYEIE
jgi:putative N6-adenine-specific DNA methylase